MIAKYFTSSVASEIAYSFWISITVIGVTTIADPIDYNAITWPVQLTNEVHRFLYPFLNPSNPSLSATGKSFVIIGISGGIARL